MTFQLPEKQNSDFYTPESMVNGFAAKMTRWTVNSICSCLFFSLTGLGIGVGYLFLKLFGVA